MRSLHPPSFPPRTRTVLLSRKKKKKCTMSSPAQTPAQVHRPTRKRSLGRATPNEGLAHSAGGGGLAVREGRARRRRRGARRARPTPPGPAGRWGEGRSGRGSRGAAPAGGRPAPCPPATHVRWGLPGTAPVPTTKCAQLT